MSVSLINLGAAPNDGTGDPARTAFSKCNSNFTDLDTRVIGVEAGGSAGFILNPEYMAAWHNQLLTSYATNAPARMVFSGDSTTAGDNTSDGFRRHQLLTKVGLTNGLVGLVGINRGVSGAHTGEWESTYRALDMAQSPNVLILAWGANDGFYGRTAANFNTSLRNGLTAIRASFDSSQLSIVLCSPVPMSDSPNNRGEAWFESIVPFVRQAAADFKCTFVDVYHYVKQATSIPGTSYMDDPFGGGRHIHPGNAMNLLICDLISRALFPIGFSQGISGGSSGGGSGGSSTGIAYVSPSFGNDGTGVVGNLSRPFATYAAALTAARHIMLLENTTVSTAYIPSSNLTFYVEIPLGVTLTFASTVGLMVAANDSVIASAYFYGRGNITLAGSGQVYRANTNLTVSIDVNVITIAAGRTALGIFGGATGAKWYVKARLIDASALTVTTDSVFLSYNSASPTITIGDDTRIRSGGIAVFAVGGPAGTSTHVGAGVLIYTTGSTIYTTAGSAGGISGAGAYFNVASTVPNGGVVSGSFTVGTWITLNHIMNGIVP